jgi:hypothetical protein
VTRELTLQEQLELQEQATKIEQIVAAAKPELLGATVGSYAEFSNVFQQLPKRLEELRTAKQVVANEALDSSMAANARTGIKNDAPTVILELASDHVSVEKSYDLTDNAITLIHELSHTIFDDTRKCFPIKDFNYRKSWAWDTCQPSSLGGMPTPTRKRQP